jgi:hypothetical protein
MKTMTNYIVWESIIHEGWEPHEFETLKQAEKYMNRSDKDKGLLGCILTKEITIIEEDDLKYL